MAQKLTESQERMAYLAQGYSQSVQNNQAAHGLLYLSVLGIAAGFLNIVVKNPHLSSSGPLFLGGLFFLLSTGVERKSKKSYAQQMQQEFLETSASEVPLSIHGYNTEQQFIQYCAKLVRRGQDIPLDDLREKGFPIKKPFWRINL